jgi:putative aldouronate transport system permease protein
MYGVQIAFKNFIPTLGIWGSPWVGFKHFKTFFDSYYFWLLIKNTVGISLYSLIVGFPAPVILALMLNEIKNNKFKKTVQTVTYAPYFISNVIMVGIILAFLSPSTGVVNEAIKAIGLKPIFFMAKSSLFKSIYVLTGVWQGAGWGSIIYLAALAGIDPQLHEAAIIDGASRLQRLWHINVQGILPTMVIILILNTGSIMNVGFEKVFLMQNSINLEASEVISTYVYKAGLLNAQYSYSAAVGLFNSVINFIVLITVNSIARRVNETSLW